LRAEFALWWAPAAALAVGALVYVRERRRAAQAFRPLASRHRQWLAENVPFYQRLTPDGRRRFEARVRRFLEERRFEGVAGQPVTDALRLALAAGEATLLHARPDFSIPPRHTLLLYPDAFDEGYDETPGGDFDGMAHPQGAVLFTAPAVEASWPNEDGHNVVLHELAHLLDFENAIADGAPSLVAPQSHGAWLALVRREMQRVKVRRSILRSYAGTNEAEFFACATEFFFERPEPMALHHPELFEAMCALFNLDPRTPDAPLEPSA
jgi:Mlc titration factor MtfA (ptsG expression regulator)